MNKDIEYLVNQVKSVLKENEGKINLDYFNENPIEVGKNFNDSLKKDLADRVNENTWAFDGYGLGILLSYNENLGIKVNGEEFELA